MNRFKLALLYIGSKLHRPKQRTYVIYFVCSSAGVAGRILPVMSRDERLATSRYDAYQQFMAIYQTFLVHSIKLKKDGR